MGIRLEKIQKDYTLRCVEANNNDLFAQVSPSFKVMSQMIPYQPEGVENSVVIHHRPVSGVVLQLGQSCK